MGTPGVELAADCGVIEGKSGTPDFPLGTRAWRYADGDSLMPHSFILLSSVL